MPKHRRRYRSFAVAAAWLLAASLILPASLSLASSYTYTGSYNGTAEALTRVTNVTVESLSDATLIGQISDFQTNDPSAACLNGESLNVWTAPAEFPGDYVVHNGEQGTQCTYVTLTFPQEQSLTMTVTASPSPATAGQSVTVTATFSQPISDGTLTFAGGYNDSVNVSVTPSGGTGSTVVQTGTWAPGTYTITAGWSGDSRYDPASGSVGVTVNAPSYTYTGSYNGTAEALTRVANQTVESLSDATLVGQLSDFQTNDPSVACLNGESLNVWTAPAEFPGDYVVHNGEQGSQCTYVTLTFPAPTTQKQHLTLTVTTSPSPTTAGQSVTVTATFSQPISDGTLTFAGGYNDSVNVSVTPSGGTGSIIVQTGTWAPGTYTITAGWSGDSRYDPASGSVGVTVNAPSYTYTGSYNGTAEALTRVANQTVESLSDATLVGQLSNFQTNDPSAECLNGESLDVWTAPAEFPGDYVVHNGDQGTQCTYVTLTFPQSAGAAGTVPPAGGTVRTSHGSAQVTAPQGAFPVGARVGIAVAPTTTYRPVPPAEHTASPVWNLSASATPVKPLSVTLRYNSAALQGKNPARLGVFRYSAARRTWVHQYAAVQPSTSTVSFRTTQTGNWAVLVNLTEFPDVPADYWARPYIDTLVGAGAIAGFPDGTFRPGAFVSRAQFVTVLLKALGMQSADPATPTFTDVSPGSWEYPYVEGAYDAGLVRGVGHGLFAPADPIQRQAMAVIAAQSLLGVTPVSAAPPSFTDGGKIASWALPGVDTAVEDGAMAGFPDGTFRPLAFTTRAQACAVVVHLMDLEAGS